MTLPPGQTRLTRFPRFGVALEDPPPPVPEDPTIEVAGAVTAPLTLRVTELGALPRREIVADLHCVTGWSATDLRWEGVPFAAFYDEVVAPVVHPGVEITHVALVGLDGYRAVALLEDLRGDDVLLAENLDGVPLDGDHGAPLRLVSPGQYGYVNAKHVCRIEAHPAEPGGPSHPKRRTHLTIQLVKPHPRARVAHEERHRYVPGRLVRPLYRFLVRDLLARRADAGGT